MMDGLYSFITWLIFLFRALMGMKGNRVLKDQMEKRYGSKVVSLYRCAVYLQSSRTRSTLLTFAHYLRRPAEVST